MAKKKKKARRQPEAKPSGTSVPKGALQSAYDDYRASYGLKLRPLSDAVVALFEGDNQPKPKP